jgi:hypothetical protein
MKTEFDGKKINKALKEILVAAKDTNASYSTIIDAINSRAELDDDDKSIIKFQIGYNVGAFEMAHKLSRVPNPIQMPDGYA